jgi:hypothetical protein
MVDADAEEALFSTDAGAEEAVLSTDADEMLSSTVVDAEEAVPLSRDADAEVPVLCSTGARVVALTSSAFAPRKQSTDVFRRRIENAFRRVDGEI